MPSPLYLRAQQELQAAALREFQAADLGRVVAKVQAGLRSVAPATVAGQITRWAARAVNPASVLDDIRRSTLGGVIRQVEQYAKGGQSEIVEAFLGALGPVGGLIRSVAAVSQPKSEEQAAKEAIAKAADLLRAFGWHVTSPEDVRNATVGDVEDEVQRITDLFEQGRPVSGLPSGGQVWDVAQPYTGHPLDEQGRAGLPSIGKVVTRGGQKKLEVSSHGIYQTGAKAGQRYDRTRRWPIDHPIVTGEMVPTPESTNVHSVGYDIEAKILYVRYQQAKPRGEKHPTHLPGPLYEYRNVPDELFDSLYRYVKSHQRAGVWIWDHIRIRGSAVSHQYPYDLAGIGPDGYMPRQAWYGPGPGGEVGEWYRPRDVWMSNREWRQSNRTDWSRAFGRGPTTDTPNKRKKSGR